MKVKKEKYFWRVLAYMFCITYAKSPNNVVMREQSFQKISDKRVICRLFFGMLIHKASWETK